MFIRFINDGIITCKFRRVGPSYDIKVILKVLYLISYDMISVRLCSLQKKCILAIIRSLNNINQSLISSATELATEFMGLTKTLVAKTIAINFHLVAK